MPINDISIVRINGKDFVSGLMWEPLKRPRAYMAEAREIGKRESMDIVAIRLGLTMIQAGFVKKGNGVTKGMYSLASALSGQIKDDSWIGAFELPGQLYALVAVHRGLIVPGCDIIADKQTVHNLLVEKDSQRKIMEFSKVYHPKDFNWRGEPLDIEEVLAPSAMRKEYILKPLKFGLTNKEIALVGGGVLVLVVVLIGYQQWVSYKAVQAAKEAARQEQLRQERLRELNALAGAEQPLQALEHPWAKQPGVEDFLNGCQGAIESLPLAIGGWVFKSAVCTPSAVEAKYARDGKTTFNDLVAAAKGRFPSDPVLLGEGNRASLDDVISVGVGGDDKLLEYPALQADLLSHMQQIDVQMAINEVQVKAPVPPSLPGGQPAPAPPPPDWKQYHFSLSSKYTPKAIFSNHNLPGIRLVEMTAALEQAQLTWTIQGDIYAR
jgi:hypothetical protein